MSERNIRIAATINGKDHGWTFRNASINQSLFGGSHLHLGLTLPGHQIESGHDQAVSNWLGEKLKLKVFDQAQAGAEKKYEGTITSITLTGNGLDLYAKSEDHLLAVNRKHRSFVEMAVKDIVTEVVQASVKRSKISPPAKSLKMKFLHQYDETDFDFLRRLARYDGCVFYHDGEEFVYDHKLGGRTSVTLAPEDVEDIALQANIGANNYRGVPYDFSVHTEPKDLDRQSGKPAAPNHKFASIANEKSDKLYGKMFDELYNEPVPDKTDFDQFLKNQQALNGGRLVTVHGVAKHPSVAIGSTIKSNQHSLLKQALVVVSMMATFDGNVYQASFEAVPENSLLMPQEPDLRKNLGLLQPARVTDNKDSKKLGRVQIQYLWDLNGKALAWARIVHAGAGKSGSGKAYGTHYIPRVGDQVLVGCENGDPSLPIIFGGLYHSQSKPDFITDNGTEEVLVARTPNESTIRVLDKKEGEEIIVSMRDKKNLIRMELKGPKITIESVSGTVFVHSKMIQVHADEKLEMKANEIEITANKNMKTTVGENLSESVGKDKTTTVGNKREETVGSDKKTKVGKNLAVIAGTNAEIKAGTNVEVEGGSSVKLKSTQVESSAAATNTIKGGLVKIN
jgi:type VI secretion system secreted protein VgrG